MSVEQVVTVEITLVVDSVGTTQTFYFATRGFTSRPTDTPANTVFSERIVDAGEYRQELFSGARVTGLSRPSFGSITLSNHDGGLDAWMGYGVSGGRVVVRIGPAGGAYPSAFTTVFQAYAKTPTVDFSTVVVPLEDRSVLFERPVATEVFSGNEAFVVGSVTKKKPLVLGEPGYVPLILVDPTRLIYYVQATATDVGFLTGARIVYDGGLPLTFAGYYPTIEDGLATSPAPGTFKVWGNNGTNEPVGNYANSVGPLYVRLGSAPQYDLRINARGLYLESQADPIRHWTFPDLVRRAGATDVTPATLAPGSYPATVAGYYLDGDDSFADVMSDSAQLTFAAYGFDELDRFFTFDFSDPDADSTEAVAFTFTTDNSRNFQRRSVPGQEKPVRQVNAAAGRTWPSSVAGAVTAADREAFTREPWQTQFTVTSDAVTLAHPGAISVDVRLQGAGNFSDADKLAWGRKYIELYGGLRELITLDCLQFDATTLGIRLGAKVQIRMPRFLCASGRNFRVVTKTVNLRSRTVSFGLWGGTTGPSDAVLGGGSGPVVPVSAADYFVRRIPDPTMFCAIAVQSIAVAAVAAIPAPTMACIVEGSSPVEGPAVDASLALYFEGADLSTSIIDSSTQAHTVTQAGTQPVYISTTSPLAGVGSGFWDTSRLLTVAHHTSLDLTSGDFALTLRMRTRTLASQVLLAKAPSTGLYPWQLAILFDGTNLKAAFRGFSSGGSLVYDLRSTTLLSLNTAYKITGTRSGNTFALQINDVTETSATASGALWSNTEPVAVGGYTNLGGVDCTIDDVVVVKGGTTLPQDTLAPLGTYFSLQLNGADGATSTTDSSVYAWPVTLAGGAELDTAQKYTGTASLLCNGTGARAVLTGPEGIVQTQSNDLTLYVRPSTVANCVLAVLGDANGFSWKLSVVSGKVKLDDNALPNYPAVSITASALPSLTAGTWTKITVRRTAPPSGIVGLYVDDAFAGWAPYSFATYGISPAAITLGADYDGSAGFSGHIDAVTHADN